MSQALDSFPGAREFIAEMDSILLEHHDSEQITEALRKLLCRSIHEDHVQLPDCVLETVEGRYARRLLYQSPDHGYSVIAMTWGPGQGTPIHDHSGMWCVEGVWHGSLEIVQYELVAHQQERFRFESRGSMEAVAGSAGSLIPPHEYHTIRNPSTDKVAVSVHIYSGCMTQCCVFAHNEGDWYTPITRELTLD